MKRQKKKDIKYCATTSQVSLWQFKQVVETGEVRYLLILDDYETLPEFDLAVLNDVWFNIYQEFSELAGGHRSDLWLMKQARLTALKFQYEADASLLRVVSQFPHPEVLKAAKEFGYVIESDNYADGMRTAQAKLNKIKGQIREQENQLKGDEEKPDLDKLITTLERWQGFQFKKKKTSVKEFAIIYKSYKENHKDN